MTGDEKYAELVRLMRQAGFDQPFSPQVQSPALTAEPAGSQMVFVVTDNSSILKSDLTSNAELASNP